jgi:hypothetical protein
MAVDAASAVGAKVVGAIREASRATGASFDYLLKAAMRESSFNPNAKSSKSSATGLFQFIDQTWLATLKQSGASVGYGRYAAAITRTSSGRYAVPNATMRRQIMNLRFDPTANATMAGVFTQRNAARLSSALGRAPTDGELYIAHFLGRSGAVKLISSAENSPNTKAANLFPHAAHANRSIFFDKAGRARTSGEVYAVLSGKIDATAPAVPAVAAAPTQPAPAAALARDATPTVAAPSIVGSLPPKTPASASPPAYSSLFASDRREPVAPFVRELWSPASLTPASLAAPPISMVPTSAAPAAAQPIPTVTPVPAVNGPEAAGRVGTSLDLFQFLRPESRPAQAARPS